MKQETQRIDSWLLEPACGNGSFLAEMLRRKLKAVIKHYRRSQLKFERYAILAVLSINGIDIQKDNIEHG
ncbi:hypothetical protein [Candidatus Nitrosacidococcus tergens]|uniref:Type III restriction system methylase n=1 Tax=Candidatus Nitrosacidococcus tergens TaxID=553981 RepID=A0A7G1QAZ9_9GAMM